MPTYEYHCDTCDRNFDAVQSFHDDPLEACPTCGSPVRKVFGSVGIVFKGSGFYKTDSRTAAAAKSGDGATTAGAGSDGSSTDGSGSGGGTDAGSGDTPAPASPPSKKEPAPTPASTSSAAQNGKSSGTKESAKT